MKRLWAAWIRAGAFRERVLRGLMPSRLHFVHYSWPLRPKLCPCDTDFCDYLAQRNVRSKSIFHFGTGGHHLVGAFNAEAGLGNHILGVTLSPPEHANYVARVIRNPALGDCYKLMFADIYSLHAAGLPSFDLATLFHLGEFAPGRVTRSGDAEVLRLFVARMAPDGLLFFYPGSYGYSKVAPLIETLVTEGVIAHVETYKSLAILRVCGPRAS